MQTPTLTTQRLILRPMRLEDADVIQHTFPHWELVKYISASMPWPYSHAAAVEHMKNEKLVQMAGGHEHHWAITEAHDPARTHIGSISLFPEDPTIAGASGCRWPIRARAT